VLEAAPHFADRYRELVQWADDGPGAGVVFADLADHVADLVAEMEHLRLRLVRCMDGVEKVASSSDDAEELIVWSFFDALSPDHVRRLDPWIGPHTRALVAAAGGDAG